MEQQNVSDDHVKLYRRLSYIWDACDIEYSKMGINQSVGTNLQIMRSALDLYKKEQKFEDLQRAEAIGQELSDQIFFMKRATVFRESKPVIDNLEKMSFFEFLAATA